MSRRRPSILIDAHVIGETWRNQGLCRGMNPEFFFPDSKAGSDAAKAVCAGCRVRCECLEYALGNRESWGVWGGCSEHERRRIITKRRRDAA